MSTQQERIVRIEHENGRRYAVSESTYLHTKQAHLGDKTYQDAGYVMVSYEDGTPLDQEPTALAIDQRVRTPEIGVIDDAGDATGTPVMAEARPAGMPITDYADQVVGDTAIEVAETDDTPQGQSAGGRRRGGSGGQE